MSGALRVLRAGPLTLTQDLGRPGHMAVGVTPSGAADRGSHHLANRLVGNRAEAATIEVTGGGLAVLAEGDLLVSLTGAPCPGLTHEAVWLLRDGDRLDLTTPLVGVRTYLAVRGGIDVEPVLGSRSHDVLSGLGPAPLRPGDVLPVGTLTAEPAASDIAPSRRPIGSEESLEVRLLPGPRVAHLGDAGLDALTRVTWQVSAQSNRVAVRLEGDAVQVGGSGTLPSEGLVRGAVQLPPSGRPVLFLADHPVTGGYPVVAYVPENDLDRVAQARPGRPVLLSRR